MLRKFGMAIICTAVLAVFSLATVMAETPAATAQRQEEEKAAEKRLTELDRKMNELSSEAKKAEGKTQAELNKLYEEFKKQQGEAKGSLEKLNEVVQGATALQFQITKGEQDILNPLHYLGLLEQRPGAFEYALPMRQWRQKWTPEYEQMLDTLRQTKPDGSGVREFVAILKLHRDHPTDMVDRAVKQALDLGAAHLDGVQLCLRQLLSPQECPPALILDHPRLAAVGYQPVRLEQYNQLLEARS